MKFTDLRTILMLCAACGVMSTAHGYQSDDYQSSEAQSEGYQSEVSQSPEQQHIPVGVRSKSPAEKKALEEMRFQMEKEAVENGEEASDTSGEDARLEQVIVIGNEERTENGEVTQKSIAKKETYVTTHEGALHRPVSVSLFGDFVELEDGSTFSVRPSDRVHTLNWLVTDTILIAPPSFWSYYQYELINQNTGATVEVDLVAGPIYGGIYTHWIVGIDYYNHRICLEDGSLWDVFYWHRCAVDNWLVGDTVIIGTNDGWFCDSRPNILINVNLNELIKCDCIY